MAENNTINKINTRIVLKNDTSTNWESSTLVLLKGEIAIATDLNKIKIGDGTKTWNELEYVGASIEEILTAVDSAYKDEDGKLIEDLMVRTDVQYVTYNGTISEFKAISEDITSIVPERSDRDYISGDMIVVELSIADENSNVNIIQYAYMYDGEKFTSLNIGTDAETVYFSQDLTITANVGVQTIDTTGSKTLNTTGKNVKQVFDMLFAEEKDPSKTLPSVSSVTIKQNGTALTKNSTYEVGTKIIPSYSVAFNAGSYTYGPATGCAVTAYHVNDSIADTEAGHAELSTQTGSFSEFELADGQTYKISATIDYSEGATPVTNLGNSCSSQKIASGTTRSKDSYTISGYRKMFWGGLVSPSTGDGAVALDTDVIRGLSKSQAAGSATLTVKAADYANAKRIIVAIPTSSNKSITEVLLASLANTPITGQFVLQDNTIDVEGANEYTAKPYKIYIYEPAQIDAGEIYTIKIG